MAVGYADAEVLRRAALVLQRRSKRPRSFWLGVVVKVLWNAADAIDAADLPQVPEVRKIGPRCVAHGATCAFQFPECKFV